MKIATIGAAALLVVVSGFAPAEGAAIKTGRWQFTTRLQSGSAQAGGATGGVGATYTSCVKSDNAVPAELGPQCKLDHKEHRGERFTWSMTCSNPQSKVRSDGVAQYHGDTMEATMVSRLPGAGGKETHMTQHITGRYVGPCLQAADMPMTPSHPTAPPTAPPAAKDMPPKPAPAAAGNAAGGTADQAAASEDTTPTGEAEATAPGEKQGEHHAASRRHRHRRHYAYRGGYVGSTPYSSGFGPAPYSNSGY
ncbi:MAG TPA: DUF3617 family protein [Stellaceae bacterium]|nr:DUF3617 family protein [Stellaceae bacterium]